MKNFEISPKSLALISGLVLFPGSSSGDENNLKDILGRGVGKYEDVALSLTQRNALLQEIIGGGEEDIVKHASMHISVPVYDPRNDGFLVQFPWPREGSLTYEVSEQGGVAEALRQRGIFEMLKDIEERGAGQIPVCIEGQGREKQNLYALEKLAVRDIRQNVNKLVDDKKRKGLNLDLSLSDVEKLYKQGLEAVSMVTHSAFWKPLVAFYIQDALKKLGVELQGEALMFLKESNRRGELTGWESGLFNADLNGFISGGVRGCGVTPDEMNSVVRDSGGKVIVFSHGRPDLTNIAREGKVNYAVFEPVKSE